VALANQLRVLMPGKKKGRKKASGTAGGAAGGGAGGGAGHGGGGGGVCVPLIRTSRGAIVQTRPSASLLEMAQREQPQHAPALRFAWLPDGGGFADAVVPPELGWCNALGPSPALGGGSGGGGSGNVASPYALPLVWRTHFEYPHDAQQARRQRQRGGSGSAPGLWQFACVADQRDWLWLEAKDKMGKRRRRGGGSGGGGGGGCGGGGAALRHAAPSAANAARLRQLLEAAPWWVALHAHSPPALRAFCPLAVALALARVDWMTPAEAELCLRCEPFATVLAAAAELRDDGSWWGVDDPCFFSLQGMCIHLFNMSVAPRVFST